MPQSTLITSFFWQWVDFSTLANGVLFDAKFITSAVVGALGVAVTMQRNLSELSAGRSKRAREKVETAKIAELLNLLAKVPPGGSLSGCKKELELQLAQSVSELDALRAKASKLAQAPNRDLTLWQRLFVWFAPSGLRAWIVHALAHLFMTGGPLVILLLLLFRLGDAARIGDITVMIVFGAFAFRAWALAERKWAKQPTRALGGALPGTLADSGPLQDLFVLRKPIGWKMLVAQVCMWTCFFCALESLEDIFLSGLDTNRAAHLEQTLKAKLGGPDGLEPKRQLLAAQEEAKRARDDAKGGLLLLVTSMLGAGICRAWAAVEWLHPSAPSHRTFAGAILPFPQPATAKAGLLIATYIGAITLFLVSLAEWSRFFNDPLDRAEFAFVSLAACVACNRLLSLSRCVAASSVKKGSATMAHPVAA
jgi:hypothetical protein